MNGTQIGFTTLCQSESEGNGNKRILHKPQNSRTVASPPDTG